MRHLESHAVTLRELQLAGATISDGGLYYLDPEKFKALRILALNHPRNKDVTNSSISLLTKLNGPETLDVRETSIDYEGVATLKKWLPKCNVLGKTIDQQR